MKPNYGSIDKIKQITFLNYYFIIIISIILNTIIITIKMKKKSLYSIPKAEKSIVHCTSRGEWPK